MYLPHADPLLGGLKLIPSQKHLREETFHQQDAKSSQIRGKLFIPITDCCRGGCSILLNVKNPIVPIAIRPFPSQPCVLAVSSHHGKFQLKSLLALPIEPSEFPAGVVIGIFVFQGMPGAFFHAVFTKQDSPKRLVMPNPLFFYFSKTSLKFSCRRLHEVKGISPYSLKLIDRLTPIMDVISDIKGESAIVNHA